MISSEGEQGSVVIKFTQIYLVGGFNMFWPSWKMMEFVNVNGKDYPIYIYT